jgi:O-antigen ligase
VPAVQQADRDAARTSPRVAEGFLAVGATIVLGGAVFAGGGSGNAAVFPLGLVCIAFVVLGVALASSARLVLPRLDRAGTITVAAAIALAGWAAAGVTWSIAADRSWDAANKGLVYVAALLLGVVFAGTGERAARIFALCLAGVLAAALVWALVGKAIPSFFADAGREARLRDPVGYWNALALLADALLPLALWIATASRARVHRALGAALAYVAVLALMLTLSRAGVLAGIAGLALWALLSRERLAGLLVAVVGGVPALAVAGWAFTRPALVDNGASYAARVDDGAVFGVLALLGLAVAVGVAYVVAIDRVVLERRQDVVRWLRFTGAALAAIGLVGLVVAVGNPVRWAGDQLGGSTAVAQGPGRLTEAGANNRLEWWGEAVDVFRAHPLAGAGAGTFAVARTAIRSDGTAVQQPHSVPLQLLAGGGIVALGLLLTFVAGAVVGVRRTLARLTRGEREAAAAVVVLPFVYALHALVDYDFDLLAVTVPALASLGLLLGACRPGLARPGVAAVVAVGLVGCAVAFSLAAPWLSERSVTRSVELVDDGSLAAAAEQAERARTWNPLSLDPVYQLATVATVAGELDRAAEWYVRGTELQPENARTWLALGTFHYALYGTRGLPADACAAYGALNLAYTLDPNGTQWTEGGPLDVVRDAVNAGACE